MLMVEMSEESNACVICLDILSETSLNDNNITSKFSCGHIFHRTCTYDYVLNLVNNGKDISCPICRNIECCADSSIYRDTRNNLERVLFDNMSNVQLGYEEIGFPLWKKGVLLCIFLMTLCIIVYVIMLFTLLK